jgi:thioredoxin-related protein
MLRYLTTFLLAAFIGTALVGPLVADEAAPHGSGSVHIPAATDLARDGSLSAEKELPIMLVFTARYCGYCTVLEEEFIKPMIISHDYDDKVIIRRLSIDGVHEIRNFDGQLVSPDRYADRHNVFLTPTILFLDKHGKELAPRMIGINTIEMYGWHLDKAIEDSIEQLRGRTRSAAKAAGAHGG